MENKSYQDLITELPQSIIDIILTKLPIRDAVRTSLLSRSWRYKWASMTHLVFDEECAIHDSDGSVLKSSIMNFITRLLFLLDGPIHKFSLSKLSMRNSPDIDQWLLFISRKDIKELVLELGKDEWFRAPSSLFSCKKLNILELTRCELILPPNFNGFSCLKYLSLRQVSIYPDDIEYLISSCPLLEVLNLSYFDSLELTVNSLSLKYLSLEGEFKDLCLANTPQLVTVSVGMYIIDDIDENFELGSNCNFDKFFGAVPRLERLVGHIYFTKYLSIGINRVWDQCTYHHLKFIELYQVSFDDVNEVLVVLQLIVNSPNLLDLQISGSSNASFSAQSPDLDFWDINFATNIMFLNLKSVNITDIGGVPNELKFIKYILERSPRLERMSLTPCLYGTESSLLLAIDILSFPRASPLATVIFHQESSFL